MMTAIAYKITGTFDDPAAADSWAQWMRDEEIDRHRSAGATDAKIIRGSEDGRTVEVRFIFASRSAFSLFQFNQGPRMYALMSTKFSPAQGAHFRRSFADIPARATVGAID